MNIAQQRKHYNTLNNNINWMREKVQELKILELIDNRCDYKELSRCQHVLKLYEKLLEENYMPKLIEN